MIKQETKIFDISLSLVEDKLYIDSTKPKDYEELCAILGQFGLSKHYIFKLDDLYEEFYNKLLQLVDDHKVILEDIK